MPANTLNIAEIHNGNKVSLHGDMGVAFNDVLPPNFSITLFTATAELFTLTSTRYQFRDFAGNMVNTVPFGGKPNLFVELTLDTVAGAFYATANNVVSLEGGSAVKTLDFTVSGTFPTLDASQADAFNFLLQGSNPTFPPLINAVVGKTYSFYLKQNPTGNRRVTFNSKYKFPNGRAPVLSTLPGTIDIVRATSVPGGIFLCETVTGYSTTPIAHVGDTLYDLMQTAITDVPDGGTIWLRRTATLQEALGTLNADKSIAIAGMPGVNPGLNVDGTIRLSFGKATINPEQGELYIRDLSMFGAAVPADGNGAAIRFNPNTRYLQVDNVRFHGNENGILTATSNPGTEVPKDVFSIVLQDSIFDNNGHSTTHRGKTHNVYFGSIQRVYAIRSRFINSEYGHDYKSRAQQNLIDRCHFYGSKNGRALDIPNGGIVHAVNSYFRKLEDAGQGNLAGIGQEGYYAREQQYIFRNCLFQNIKSNNYNLSFFNQDTRVQTPIYFIDCVFLDHDETAYNVCEAIHIHTGGPLGPEGYTGPTGFIPRRFKPDTTSILEYSIHPEQPVLIQGPDPTLDWFPPTNSPATNPQAPNPATVLVRTSSTKNYPGTNAGAGGNTPPPPPPDTENPVVSLSSSATNVEIEQTITLTAAASDNRGVSRVEFFRNNDLLVTDSTAPWSTTVRLDHTNNGTITFKAVAYDAAGNADESDPVVVTVNVPEPVIIGSNILMDDATRAEYDAAIAGGTTGQKRLAAATAIRNAMRPDYRLYIYQNSTLVIPVEYTGDMVIDNNGTDINLTLGVPDSADPLVAADLTAGNWRFELQGGANYARHLIGSVGAVGSGMHLELDSNPQPGDGFDQQITFTVPRSIDGQ